MVSEPRVVAVLMLMLMACDVTEGVPEGKLAVVGPVALGPEDIAAARSQVGKYGQLRFSGAEADATMLEALIATELMALEAGAQGYETDPRVEFALEEEIATVYLSAQLERAVPRDAVANDVAALRAYYDMHAENFTNPAKRSAQGVVFDNFQDAESALLELRAGTKRLEDFGDVFATPMQARDDLEYPAFHPVLFDPSLREGDFMAHPVFLGESLFVGRVQKIAGPSRKPFDDPAVQEELVEAVLQPLRARARAKILAELRGEVRGGL